MTISVRGGTVRLSRVFLIMLDKKLDVSSGKMMLRFWLVCFALLFVVVSIWEWLRELTLAFPLCLLGGVILAIASNLKFVAPPSPSNQVTLPPDSSSD
jgi:hypothetical protein